MLYRALGHLESGCYVDIGAQHPEIDSVSKAFFEWGWHGVHVEPVPHYANLLRNERPGDRVIEAAVSNYLGYTKLIVFPDTGLSTTVPQIAAGHVDLGCLRLSLTCPPSHWPALPRSWATLRCTGLRSMLKDSKKKFCKAGIPPPSGPGSSL